MMASGTTDLTRGNSTRQLIAFTLPLILGNVFQLAYNTVDTAVIGRFAGSVALAAVGTCDPVMSLLILGVSGMCIGASVIMGQLFGAGDEEQLRQEMRTTVTMGLIFALAVLAVGLPATEGILKLMQVQPEAMEAACLYLRIIFLGMPFTCLYNIYSAALRSLGDAKTPIHYLILAQLLNMALDLLLVWGLGLGVAGAAIATVAAEGLSAILCILHVDRHTPQLRFDWLHLGIHRQLARKTLSWGGLTALQQCSQPIGNLLIQGTVNGLGIVAAAAFSGVRKIEDLGLIPGRSVSNAITAFTAQNIGAEQYDRTEDGFWKGIRIELGCGVLVCAGVLLLRAPLMNLFTTDPAVVTEGIGYFALIGFGYWISCLTNGTQGYFRGVGKMRLVLFGTLTQISVRVIASLLLTPTMGISGVGLACILGWLTQLSWQAPVRYLTAKNLEK